MKHRPTLLASLSTACLQLALAATGCAAPTAAAQPAAPARVSPAYHGVMAQTFDDTIAPEALRGSGAAEDDAWVGPRTQAADHVLRVKVISTTTQGVGHRQGYLLTVRVLGAPLAGAAPPSDTLELRIPRESGVFPLARMHDLNLTDKVFIGFFKTFGAGDASALHWHLKGERAETLQAVARASTLADVGYQQALPGL